MLATAILQTIASIKGNVVYQSYDAGKVKIQVGAAPVSGFQYVFAQHLEPQRKLIMSMNAKGIFVSNKNKSGIIEMGIMDTTVSSAEIDILDSLGVPVPITVTDLTTGGTSTVIGSACARTGTPQWRRDRLPSLQIFTFETPRLLVSGGVRLPA